jgi:alanine dehydrogenase
MSAAASSGLGTAVKYLVNKNAGAGNIWTKAHYKKAGFKILLNPSIV